MGTQPQKTRFGLVHWQVLLLLGLNQAAQISICCRRCVRYSSDPWKASTCPSYRIASALFGR